jgi:hypothetical protein
MSADIIQFVPHAYREDMRTNSAAIALRSTRQSPASDPADALSGQRTATVDGEV